MEETKATMTAEEMQGEPAAKENETKAEKFIRIGEYRMNKAVDAIGRLENLANRSSYEYTQEQVDEMIQSAVAEIKPFESDDYGFTITVKGEGDNVTAVSCSTEDVQAVVDVLQMNADDGAKAVANVKSDSVLILLHALDTRATVKKAAQKQHDTLFSADGNSNESVGGNASTDGTTEGADT